MERGRQNGDSFTAGNRRDGGGAVHGEGRFGQSDAQRLQPQQKRGG